MPFRRILVITATLAFWLMLANGAVAQLSQSKLWTGAPIPCAAALADAERLNGPQLFHSAGDCARQGRDADAVFLKVAGQIRSMTDMMLLRPSSDEDEVRMSELAAALWGLGGTGPRHLYSDSTTAEQLFQRLENWRPARFADYDPGWRFRASARHTHYDTVSEEFKQGRLAQLRDYAALAADPHYAALEKELEEIHARHPRGLTPDSEDYTRSTELHGELRSIARNRATHQQALAGRKSVLDDLPPELDEGVEQIFTGYNGLEEAFTWHFSSEQEVLGSWLSRALSPEDLTAVLSQVDFDAQVLVVHTLGKRTSATGNLHFSEISYNAIYQSWSVGVRVGVRENSCTEEHSAESYPFVIAVAPKPPGPATGFSHSNSNFPDGCKPPVAAEATQM